MSAGATSSPAPAAVVEEGPAEPGKFLERVELGQLRESPLNPRKHFDAVKLQELAASIASKGVIEPLILRPMAKGSGYEIVVGARRYRAALLAKIEFVPAIVRELTDAQVLELMVVENNQRDDVHPLEEADGFVRLMKEAGYDIAEIAGKVGRSTKYVYDRIKLLQLVPEAKKLFLAGEFEAGHAIILARLPAEWQKKAIDKDAEGRFGRSGGLFTGEFADAPPDLPAQERLKLEDRVKPISVRELQTWVDDNVRFRPEENDLPNLFPETQQVLENRGRDDKLVYITHDYRCTDETRDPKQRTYGEAHWRRADGREKSKTCDRSVIGVVASGPGRGDALRVCVDKVKCRVHWPAPRKSKASTGAKEASWQDRQRKQNEQQQREQKKRAQLEARWKKATPAIAAALAEQIRKLPATSGGPLGQLFLHLANRDTRGALDVKGAPARGKSAEDLVRHAAYLVLYGELSAWYAWERFPKRAKAFGVDVSKIMKEVAPEAKVEKAPAKKKGKKR